jgi:hypothetical protein
MKNWFKTNWPHLAAVGFFVVLSVAFLSPVLEGKVLQQGDVIQAEGMQHEIVTYAEKDGDMPLWTNAMFGGMPAYMILIDYKTNISWYLVKFIETVLPNRIYLIFMYLAGMYFLLSVLGVSPVLAVAGAIGFAFSSYNIIIIEAGHVNKVLAVSLFAPMLASIILIFKDKKLLGSALLALFFSMELRVQHIQMTYYFFLTLGLIFLFHIIYERKELEKIIGQFSYIIIAFAIGALTNISSLMLNNEFAKETIRGKSELTLDQTKPTDGLDKDYAFQWSYGIAESFTFLIPNMYGGASGGVLSKDSETAKAIRKQGGQVNPKGLEGMPTYWGEQPFTSGPVYLGALLMLLFVLAMLFVKHPLKWPLFIAFIFSLILSWGKNFISFNGVFFDAFPLYNKFRSVTSILVIAEFSVVVLAVLFLHELLSRKITKEELMKKSKPVLITFGGILLVLAVVPGMFFEFSSTNDTQLPEWIIDAIQSDRKSLLTQDALRTLLFIAAGVTTLWFFITSKIKADWTALILTALLLMDMWGVDKRYLNENDFVKAKNYKNIHQPRPVETQLLQDNDPNFRVYDATINTFNSASTSYHLKTIGGYNAAKLRRYQDLIDYQISKGNMNVLNMLNTKYIIQNDQENQPVAFPNAQTFGNAWFVDSIMWVDNANEEMLALDSTDVSHVAIVDERFKDVIGNTSNFDTSSTITLTSYHPEKLVYEYNAPKASNVVFSEIYYDKGWRAFIDGIEMPYFRANYVLRGLSIPEGKHSIVFEFHPDTYYKGEQYAMVGSVLLILLFGAALIKEYKKP